MEDGGGERDGTQGAGDGGESDGVQGVGLKCVCGGGGRCRRRE